MSNLPQNGIIDSHHADGEPESATTALVVELDRGWGDNGADRAHDIVLRAGGIEVSVAPSAAGHLITASFHSICDATSAVVEIVENVMRARAGTGDRVTDVRMAFCTGGAGTDPSGNGASLRAARLLAQAGPRQILATAPAAVVAGPMLPPNIDLLDRGTWIPGPEHSRERIYELRINSSSGGADAASNLEWARRAVGSAGWETLADLDGHLSRLLETWRQAVKGNRRMLLITGGSNAHRTALIAEASLRLHADGALVLYGRWDKQPSTPYQAFREALGVYAVACGTEQLRADLEGRGDEIATLLPEVGRSVGRPRTGRQVPYVDSMRLFEAIERWLLAITARTPVLLVLDDVQWAEQSSVALLGQLWHAFRKRPIMIMVTGSAGSSSAGQDPAVAADALDRLVELATYTEAGAFGRLRLEP